MEIVSKDEVLNVVRMKGPVLPREIVKALGKSDTFMVGAVLSELIKSGVVKVTNTKIGASPTYYVEGQEKELERLSDYLNEKDRRTFDMLKLKKVLQDSKLDALNRVSVRSIKDFAKPLHINLNGNKEIFWKWYMISNNEAVDIIKSMFSIKREEKNVVIKKQEQKDVNEKIENRPTESEKKTYDTFKKQDDEKKIFEKSLKQNVFEKKSKISDFDKKENLEKTEFLDKIKDFFEKNEIKIIEEFLVKKNTEYNFLIQVPSAFGVLNYFCKAKSKKKCNESDVGSAYMEADQYRLPTIFLTTGEFTKKAEVELEKFKGITIKKI